MKPSERPNGGGCGRFRIGRMTMNKIIGCVLLVAGAFQVLATEPVGTILCFGDSITAAKDGWVDKLGAKSNRITMLKAGQNGRLTSKSDKVLPPVLAKYPNADYVLVLLGVNNLKHGGEERVKRAVDDMGWMLDLIKAKLPKAHIYLMAPINVSLKTMNELNAGKGYNESGEALALLAKRYEVLAKEKGVDFINLLNAVSLENYRDGVHPDEQGHQQMADAVWRELNK